VTNYNTRVDGLGRSTYVADRSTLADIASAAPSGELRRLPISGVVLRRVGRHQGDDSAFSLIESEHCAETNDLEVAA